MLGMDPYRATEGDSWLQLTCILFVGGHVLMGIAACNIGFQIHRPDKVEVGRVSHHFRPWAASVATFNDLRLELGVALPPQTCSRFLRVRLAFGEAGENQ